MKSIFTTLSTVLLLLSVAVVSHSDVINGKVLDAHNKAIADAAVLIQYQNKPDQPIQYEELNTDSKGNFSVELSKNALGNIANAFAAAPKMAPAMVELKTFDNVIVLKEAKVLRGRVVDEQNHPVAGVTVQLLRIFKKDKIQGGFFEMTPWRKRFSAVTDANGYWQMQHVPEGYNAGFRVWDKRFVTQGFRYYVGKDVPLIIVKAGATLRGRVVDADGNPVAEANVTALKNDRTFASFAVTASDGSYEITGLKSGLYSVRALPQKFSVAEIKNVTAVAGKVLDVGKLVVTPGGAITGSVRNSKTSKPVRGVKVEFIRPGLYSPLWTITDPKGDYIIEHLSPDVYKVHIQVEHEGYLVQGITKTVEVREERTSTVDFSVIPGTQLKVSQSAPSPEKRIISFLKALRTSFYPCGKYDWRATHFVSISHTKKQLLKSVHQELQDNISRFSIEASGFMIIPNPDNAKLATVNFTLTFSDAALGYEFQHDDSVQIRLEKDKSGQPNWKIIPLKPSYYLERFYENGATPRKSTFTNFWASEIAYPQEMQNGFHLYAMKNQLQEIGLALSMLTQDYDERYAFTETDYVRKLAPYLEKSTDFTAPGDNPGTISYAANPHILGFALEEIKERRTLVVFYFGKNQKLDFRYSDLSPVLFANGKVKLVTREQAKDLRWRP